MGHDVGAAARDEDGGRGENRVGGRCLNYACIPAKAVLRVADVLSEVRDANKFGIKVTEPEIDYAAVSAHREKVIKTLTGGVSGLQEEWDQAHRGRGIAGGQRRRQRRRP